MTRKDYVLLARWIVTSHQSRATAISLGQQLFNTQPGFSLTSWDNTIEDMRATEQLAQIVNQLSSAKEIKDITDGK